jgi:hypothetical protein
MEMMMEMIALTPEGDTKYQWDVADPSEVEQARALFAKFRDQGYAVFQGSRKGEPVREFDPSIKTMLFVPIMAGG